MDPFEASGSIRLGVAASLGREYARDLKSFLGFLIELLQKALPAETEVLTRGFFKKEVVGVEVTLGMDQFRFEDTGKGSIVASKIHVVRGIALKREELPVEQALAEFSEAVEAKLASNERARAALASLLGLS